MANESRITQQTVDTAIQGGTTRVTQQIVDAALLGGTTRVTQQTLDAALQGGGIRITSQFVEVIAPFTTATSGTIYHHFRNLGVY